MPIPVIDLFAGAGGLGEGFAALRFGGGKPVFRVGLSIEQEAYAHQTLCLRHFFHQFPKGGAPVEYYRFLRGELSRENLFGCYPEEADAARVEAREASLGLVPPEELDGWVYSAIKGSAGKWVLVGGPPCQAFSIAGRARNKGVQGYRIEDDPRLSLWREYLGVIVRHQPAVFIMENVTGLLSVKAHGRRVIDLMLGKLSKPCGHHYRIYSIVNGTQYGDGTFDPSALVVEAERLGIPQARHRVIIMGVRDDIASVPALLPTATIVPAGIVLDDLPSVRSGLSGKGDNPDRWMDTLQQVREVPWLRTGVSDALRKYIENVVADVTQFPESRGAAFVPSAPHISEPKLAQWIIDENVDGACNHTTRAHMAADLHRYLYAASHVAVYGHAPTLDQFPPELLPNHQSVARGHFLDRFRVQLRDSPATTVTGHIARDGHYYIHYDPRQCRSLTVREAARLQTFPDNFFFCGPRTAQYLQVGNAVPPYLAMHIAWCNNQKALQASVISRVTTSITFRYSLLRTVPETIGGMW